LNSGNTALSEKSPFDSETLSHPQRRSAQCRTLVRGATPRTEQRPFGRPFSARVRPTPSLPLSALTAEACPLQRSGEAADAAFDPRPYLL
jgi:hypothetical protein